MSWRLLVFVLVVHIGGSHGATSQPNVILMVADDMGWGDLGINVPHLPSNTPYLDALARRALRFNDFHSGASLCTPSRAALLTGRMGLRTGVIHNFEPQSVAGLPRNETTLAEVLRQTGYRTAMFGKWHLGTQPGYHPMDRGFESYLGVPYSLDMGCTTPPGIDLPPKDACPTIQLENVPGPSTAGLAVPLYRNRQIQHQPVSLSLLAKHYAAFGERFILQESSKPFFLYAAFSHVHVPLAHGQRFSNTTGRGLFADTLAEMDWVAGRLARAAARQGGSTLIWFMSDNGPWDVKCSLAGLSGPFLGAWQRNVSEGGGGSAAKTTVWEAGHRVPAFLHWPQFIKKGGTSNALLSALDVLPTIASLAGASLPEHRVFDGVNIAQELVNHRNITGHSELFHPNSGSSGPYGAVGAVRVGRYKTLLYAGGSPSCTQPASHPRKLQPPLAFDLRKDLAEANPLPDPIRSAIVERAERALKLLLASVRVDNTSTTNYAKNPADEPCCDLSRVACTCPWD